MNSLILSSSRAPDNPVGFNSAQMVWLPCQQHRQQPELPLFHPIDGILTKTGCQLDSLAARAGQQQRRLLPCFIQRTAPARSHHLPTRNRRNGPPQGPLTAGIATHSQLATGRIPGRHYGVGRPFRRRKGCNKADFSVVFPQIHVNHMLHSITFYRGENGGNPKYHAVNSGFDLYQTRVKKLLSDGKECCYAPVN